LPNNRDQRNYADNQQAHTAAAQAAGDAAKCVSHAAQDLVEIYLGLPGSSGRIHRIASL